MVCQPLHIRCITLLNVVEAHGKCAFAGTEVVKSGGLRISVATGADGDFYPGKEILRASAGVPLGYIAAAAVVLLPHLVEAVDRVSGEGVIGDVVGDLVCPWLKAIGISNAGIDCEGRQIRWRR